jgi:AbrB family looped-hinge helix DNA binding protein
MAIMQAMIDKFGRVLIPKGLRDDLGLTEGTPVSVEASEDHLVIRPARPVSPVVKKGHVLVFTGAPGGLLKSAVAEDRERRSTKNTRRVKGKP